MSFRLGYYLVKQNLLQVEQIDRAMRRQMMLGGAFDTHLLELGLLSMDDLQGAFAALYDWPQDAVNWIQQPSPEARALLPQALAEKFGVVPVHQQDNTLYLLTDDQGAPPEQLPLSYWLQLDIVALYAPEIFLKQGLEAMYHIPMQPRFQQLSMRPDVPELFTLSETLRTPTSAEVEHHIETPPVQDTPIPRQKVTEDADSSEEEEEKSVAVVNDDEVLAAVPTPADERFTDASESSSVPAEETKHSESDIEDVPVQPTSSSEPPEQSEVPSELPVEPAPSIEPPAEPELLSELPEEELVAPVQEITLSDTSGKLSEAVRTAEYSVDEIQAVTSSLLASKELAKEPEITTEEEPTTPPSKETSTPKKVSTALAKVSKEETALTLPPVDRLRSAFRPSKARKKVEPIPNVDEPKKPNEPKEVVQKAQEPEAKAAEIEPKTLEVKTPEAKEPAKPKKGLSLEQKREIFKKTKELREQKASKDTPPPASPKETLPLGDEKNTKAPTQATPAPTPVEAMEPVHQQGPVLQTPPPQSSSQVLPALPPLQVATLPQSVVGSAFPPLAGAEVMTIPGLPAFPPLMTNEILPALPTMDDLARSDAPAHTEDDDIEIEINLDDDDAAIDGLPPLRSTLEEYLKTNVLQQRRELSDILVQYGGNLAQAALAYVPLSEDEIEKAPDVAEKMLRLRYLCEQIGEPMLYRVLQVLQQERGVPQKKAFTLMGYWSPTKAMAILLQTLLSEKEAEIRQRLRRILMGYKDRSEFSTLLQFLRSNLRSKDPERLQKAIMLIEELRIVDTVGELIDLLMHESANLRRAALMALRRLCFQSFGESEEVWRIWWEENQQFERKHWIVESMNHVQSDIRAMVKEDLVEEFGDDFGYDPEASEAEREAIQKLASLWLSNM